MTSEPNPSDNKPADQYLTEGFVRSLHGRVVQLETSLAENTAATKENTDSICRVENNTKGILEMFGALEGGFKVLQGLGRLARPIVWISTAITGIVTAWATWKSR